MQPRSSTLVWDDLGAGARQLRCARPALGVPHPLAAAGGGGAMRLNHRVRRLESDSVLAGCGSCRGLDRSTLRVWIKGEPEPPVPSCPECGRPARAVTTVIIESGLDRAREPVTEEFGGTFVSVTAARYGSG